MAFARHGKGFSGGHGGAKKFGGTPRGRGFSDRSERPQMFPTTCSNCSNPCEVPFRPNGKKPVLCRECFSKDNGFESRPSKFNDRPRSTGNDGTAEQLRSINEKLDAILKAINND
jgi:CxxC-x17-CxxC domain-containing protein